MDLLSDDDNFISSSVRAKDNNNCLVSSSDEEIDEEEAKAREERFGKERARLQLDCMLRTPKPFRCDICRMTFPSSGHLRRHGHAHIGRKEHPCFLIIWCWQPLLVTLQLGWDVSLGVRFGSPQCLPAP